MKISKKNLATILLLASALLVPITFSGCKSEGPAEKTGKKIDQSVEDMKESVNKIEDKITDKGPAEKAGEKIDETVDKVKESMNSDQQNH